jgi:hypothetical protein
MLSIPAKAPLDNLYLILFAAIFAHVRLDVKGSAQPLRIRVVASYNIGTNQTFRRFEMKSGNFLSFSRMNGLSNEGCRHHPIA